MGFAKTNYWVDVSMGIAFALSFVTGVIKWPRLIAWLGLSYRQLPMGLLTIIHDWSGVALGLLVLLHLLLHRKWISCMTKQFFKRKEDKKCEPQW